MAVDRLLQFLYTSAAPCALFALGVTVALRPLERMPWEVPLLAAVKLVVHPILVLVLLGWLGPFSEVWINTAVLMAALPPALSAYVFARQYDIWIEQASSAVLIGTLALGRHPDRRDVARADATLVHLWCGSCVMRRQLVPERSYRGLSPVSRHPLAPEHVESWIPATSARITRVSPAAAPYSSNAM